MTIGRCQAELHVGDDYGDNHATCRCDLAAGHEPPHRHEWVDDDDRPIVVTFHCDDKPTECAVHTYIYDEAADDGSEVCAECGDVRFPADVPDPAVDGGAP